MTESGSLRTHLTGRRQNIAIQPSDPVTELRGLTNETVAELAGQPSTDVEPPTIRHCLESPLQFTSPPIPTQWRDRVAVEFARIDVRPDDIDVRSPASLLLLQFATAVGDQPATVPDATTSPQSGTIPQTAYWCGRYGWIWRQNAVTVEYDPVGRPRPELVIATGEPPTHDAVLISTASPAAVADDTETLARETTYRFPAPAIDFVTALTGQNYADPSSYPYLYLRDPVHDWDDVFLGETALSPDVIIESPEHGVAFGLTGERVDSVPVADVETE